MVSFKYCGTGCHKPALNTGISACSFLLHGTVWWHWLGCYQCRSLSLGHTSWPLLWPVFACPSLHPIFSQGFPMSWGRAVGRNRQELLSWKRNLAYLACVQWELSPAVQGGSVPVTAPQGGCKYNSPYKIYSQVGIFGWNSLLYKYIGRKISEEPFNHHQGGETSRGVTCEENLKVSHSMEQQLKLYGDGGQH